MSVITSKPAITRQELDDLRWLAREALADAGESVNATGKGLMGDLARLHDCTRALVALGVERADPYPGTEYDRDEHRWPYKFDETAARVLLREADTIGGFMEWIVEHDAEDYPEGVVAGYFAPRLERVRRARAVLERALLAPDGGASA
jgi:hypothetical protein